MINYLQRCLFVCTQKKQSAISADIKQNFLKGHYIFSKQSIPVPNILPVCFCVFFSVPQTCETSYFNETIFNLRKIKTEHRISKLGRRIIPKCLNKRFSSGGIWNPSRKKNIVRKFRTFSRSGEEKEDILLWISFDIYSSRIYTQIPKQKISSPLDQRN